MDTPSSLSDAAGDELAAAFERLDAAVARREQEHARQGRYRAWFGRGILFIIVAIFVGLWMLVRSFNTDVFTAQLGTKVSDGAPGVLKYAKQTVEALAPVYQAEVERTMPVFLKSLTDVITKEAGHLAEAITPLARGDASVYTADANDALAKALLSKFNKEIKTEAEAKALAQQIRDQQLLAAPQTLHSDLAGPFGALHDIEMSLRNMGPPDKELISKGDTIDALAKGALDVVKARLISGEGLGFGDEKSAKPASAKKGGK